MVVIETLENIRTKEVIDIVTGERLGYIDDVEMNIQNSEITALLIYGRHRFLGLLGKEDDIIIPCREIEVIGEEIVLIRRSPDLKLSRSINKRKIPLESLFK